MTYYAFGLEADEKLRYLGSLRFKKSEIDDPILMLNRARDKFKVTALLVKDKRRLEYNHFKPFNTRILDSDESYII